MKSAAWQQLARRRILSVLRRRRVASLRQLESKISDAGPLTARPEPHHLSPALHALIADGVVRQVAEVRLRRQAPTPLYAHPTFDPRAPQDESRLAFIQQAYETYLAHALSPQGGTPLELVVHASLRAAGTLHWLGRPGTVPSGAVLNDRSFTDHGKLDHLLIDKRSSLLIGVEDKNHREWIYPHSPYLRTLLKKCVLYDVIPLFITRRLPWISRVRVLPAIGMLAFQTYYQFFSPDDASSLAQARHTDGLGFHDMRFNSDPLPTLVHYFRSTLPKQLPAIHDRFQANKAVISAYAVDEAIDYDDLIRELEVFYPKSAAEEEPDYEDYLDY